MKRLLTATMLGGFASAALVAGSGDAGAAVEPGLYRACPVATSLPGSFGCRTLTMRQYIAEVRRPQAFGIGYGPLISTPTGGYMKLHAFGGNDKGRLVFRKNATGYDVYTSTVDKTFYAKLKLTRLR